MDLRFLVGEYTKGEGENRTPVGFNAQTANLGRWNLKNQDHLDLNGQSTILRIWGNWRPQFTDLSKPMEYLFYAIDHRCSEACRSYNWSLCAPATFSRQTLNSCALILYALSETSNYDRIIFNKNKQRYLNIFNVSKLIWRHGPR